MTTPRINLNLVPALRALLREGNVSKAADTLGITQSGASAALRRLRQAFDDPLLVQVGQRMELTRRARDLVEPVEQIFQSLERLLLPVECDPAQLDRGFKIWTVDFAALQTATLLLPQLAATAPGVRLQFAHSWPPSASEVLRSGEADLAIVPTQTLDIDSPSLDRAPLYHDRMVAVVPAGHPLASQETLTREDMGRYPHVAFQEGLYDWNESLRYTIAGQPPNVPVAAHLQQLALLPMLAARTGTIAITTLTAARQFADLLPIQIREIPGGSPGREVCLAWSVVHTPDPVHAWMRNLIIEAFRDLEASLGGAVA